MDIEQAMQFILEQQAQFASDIGQLNEAAKAQQEQFGSEMARINAAIERITGVVMDVAGTQERTNEILATLAEKHVELTSAHKLTEDKLNALIDTVERHISGHGSA
jgi:hypothetical protein